MYADRQLACGGKLKGFHRADTGKIWLWGGIWMRARAILEIGRR